MSAWEPSPPSVSPGPAVSQGGERLSPSRIPLLPRFMFILMIILTAFLCGLNNIYVPYQETERLGKYAGRRPGGRTGPGAAAWGSVIPS